MHTSFGLLLEFTLRITHRRQHPMPDPHHFIHQQVFGQGMGNEQHGDLALELVDGGGEVFGGGAVQAAGCFVEDQYPGLLDECPGDGQALLLSAGQAHAALADLGLVALRQRFDGVVDFRHLAGLHDLVEAGMGVGHQQVVVEGAGEQDGFLRHQTYYGFCALFGRNALITSSRVSI